MTELVIPTAEVFYPALEPARYKALHGGRGSGKSHFVAGDIIDKCVVNPGYRVVCIREVQKSLKDSAKLLIEDKLKAFKLGTADGFRIYNDSISTPGGGVILFHGMQDHTAESIKSLEGFDMAWVEEAQTMTQHSLKMLRPTIRKPNSELYFSWNPRRKMDAVDILFRQQRPPTDSVVIKANWNDNPWFPAVLEQERLDCLANEPEEYDHVWEGGYATVAKGAYYARFINEARMDGRVTTLTEDPNLIIRLFVDIGGTGAKADNFVIIAAQFRGMRVNVLNHYTVQGQDGASHLAWMREQGYSPDRCKIWLPHDGKTHDKVINISYESMFQNAGYEVEIVPNQGRGAANMRIQEARRVFPSVWFNEETCSDLLEALGYYHEKRCSVRNIGLGPDHDWSSHDADTFGLMCLLHDAGPQRQFKPITFGGWRG